MHASYSPASEATLILFAAHLALEKILYATIKVYLAVVCDTYVAAGLHSHFQQQLTSRLQLTLEGIKKHQATRQPDRTRLPITLDIMNCIKDLLSSQPSSYLHIMIWEACCLAFFGFLRVSKFTMLGDNQFDELCHLSLNSVTIDNRYKPTQLKITIKQSKTDPFCRGVDICIGTTEDYICPLGGIYHIWH